MRGKEAEWVVGAWPIDSIEYLHDDRTCLQWRHAICMHGTGSNHQPCTLYCTVQGGPFVCVYTYVCVEHENVPWSLNRVGTSQSFIIFALFLFFFVYFCSTSVFLSFRLSLCFLFLVYDKFNDLFVVLCFRRCLSSTHNTATRDYVMFVVYLVVVSTFFFFLLPSLLYFVLRKQVLRHGVYSTNWYWYCRGSGEPSVKLCKLKFDMRN